MPTDQIVQLLIAERDRLNAAISVLQGPMKRRGRPPKNAAVASVAAPAATANLRKSGMTAAARKAQSKRMKAYWATRRKKAKE